MKAKTLFPVGFLMVCAYLAQLPLNAEEAATCKKIDREIATKNYIKDKTNDLKNKIKEDAQEIKTKVRENSHMVSNEIIDNESK